MRLTQKLVRSLSRVFNRSPTPQLALRLRYDGVMTWRVQDNVLTTSVTGGSGSNLSVDLTAYSLFGLVNYLSAQPGYSVPYSGVSGWPGLKATVLLDGEGDQDLSNGDHLNAYTSVLWAWLEPLAIELKAAADAIDEMVLQMVPQTASGEWLDQIGAYYATDRLAGESDPVYATRIISSIGKPAGNNVALEVAINTIAGGLEADVVDVPAQAFTSPASGTSFGLFDVVYSVDLSGSEDLNAYTTRVVDVIERLRDAGTHMRAISISGRLADTYPTASASAEAFSSLTLAQDDVAESAALVNRRHNSVFLHDGSIPFDSGDEDLVITVSTSGVAGGPELL